MDMETFSRRESMLKLREQLVAVEEDRVAGKKGLSIDTVDELMKKAIEESANGQRR